MDQSDSGSSPGSSRHSDELDEVVRSRSVRFAVRLLIGFGVLMVLGFAAVTTVMWTRLREAEGFQVTRKSSDVPFHCDGLLLSSEIMVEVEKVSILNTGELMAIADGRSLTGSPETHLYFLDLRTCAVVGSAVVPVAFEKFH